jgi:8-oxo-dGTP pyrophosphatase MutT (NUDIX family)
VACGADEPVGGVSVYVHCECGHRHWGLYGAAGLLITDPGRTGLVLQQRSDHVHHGGTWALIGGAVERGESAARAALREAQEEEGLDPASVTVLRSFVGTDHPSWTYTYVLAETARPEDPVLARTGGWESDGARWVDLADVPSRPLHPALRADWPRVLRELEA